MFILSETPRGYGLLKITDKDALSSVDTVKELFQQPEKAKKALDLVEFRGFSNQEEAMEACLLGEEDKKKLIKPLKKILKNHQKTLASSTLLLENPKVGSIINKKLSITCQADAIALEVVRNIREHFTEFVCGLTKEEAAVSYRGLAHHFSRFKLQFDAEKEDSMIIHAIKLLEDLDKWLNQLCMRLREWFGINFPELQKIVNDNIIFAKIVHKGKTRSGVLEADFSDFMDEEMEKQVKDAAKYSMGTKITEDDLERVRDLAKLIIDYNEDRGRLNAYLTSRMASIAPNLTAVVGERVGAKLIAHASSLTNLAKCPASTLQIMGAEKALFRAMKTKSATPKYGHIYHASLVGQSGTKIRGKIARTLACKASLASRVDAFDHSNNDAELGLQLRKAVERRIENLTHGKTGRYTSNITSAVNPVATVVKTKKYQAGADVKVEPESKKRKIVELKSEVKEEPAKKKKKKKKKEKGKKRKIEEVEVEETATKKVKVETKKKKKKKKKDK
jgi:nucleolar protein 58